MKAKQKKASDRSTSAEQVERVTIRKGLIWDDPITKVIQELGYEGFTHRLIASCVRVSGVGVATYRLHRLGISTADVRSGQSKEARERIATILHKHGLPMPRKF